MTTSTQLAHTGWRRRHNGASYMWLGYTAFFFVDPYLTHSATHWLHCFAIYAAFLGIYVAYLEWEGRYTRLGLIAAMYLLGIGTIPVSEGSITFIIFASALLPFCLESVTLLVSLMLFASGSIVAEGWLLHRDLVMFCLNAFFLLVVGGSNIFIAQQKRANKRLNAAHEENAALAAVAERERIARDLHDVLGHTLSVIVLKTELARRLMDIDQARAKAEIEEIERTARTALAEVREAIGGYRSRGLRAEIEQARHTLETAGVTLHCDTPPPALRPSDETVLSLAVREAVTNIVRHAHASRCTMEFTTSCDGLRVLTVHDDGPNAIIREGNGLRGMRERVQSLGGRLRIERKSGTRLVIELPA